MNHVFADILLPIPISQIYSYEIPEQMEKTIARGMRVIVPFGIRKFRTGIVHSIHTEAHEKPLKPVFALLDETPVVLEEQIKLWEWIADYYQCTLGEVYKAAIPSGFKLESETIINFNSDFEGEIKLTNNEQRIADIIEANRSLSLDDIIKASAKKNVFPIINSLQSKNIIAVNEEVSERYKPKKEDFIRISTQAKSNIEATLQTLSKSKKQQQLFATIIDLTLRENATGEIEKKTVLSNANSSNAILKELAKKNYIEIFPKNISRLNDSETRTRAIFPLNKPQEEALSEIERQFKEKNVVLLHGVTSSGKTEIYIHLIEKTLKQGKQVLYLIPEIALTTQLASRLKQVFGNKLGIYHSRFSSSERVEIWNNLLHNKGYEVILGVRSSIFLPFRQLGLIIVDEEHEPSFKQYDPAPRYHARNTAIMLGHMHQAKTLLGTATPAIESYSNAAIGKYGLVNMTERYESIQHPEIVTVDLKTCYHKKQMNGHFSKQLISQMETTLNAGEQIILFQNRRGYAPFIECKLCAWTPRCPHCDVSLTYHKRFNKLTCHYCGYTEPMPEKCPSCEQESITTKGFGTEQIEEEVGILFPNVPVSRMDLDTTRSKRAYENIIADFESQKSKILIGTQLISKGLDFEHVGLVGILNADNLLNYPDFRAHERAFQMLTQVSGRAGRKNKRGLVILQTSSPELPLMQYVVENNYQLFFKQQMTERDLFHYPPFYRLIQINLRHRDATVVAKASAQFAALLRTNVTADILGPSNPPVGKIQNMYIKQILIKFHSDMRIEIIKRKIIQLGQQLLGNEQFGQIRISYDVDPM